MLLSTFQIIFYRFHMKVKLTWPLIIFIGTLASCYSNKRLVYLSDGSFSERTATFVESKKAPYHLQPFDVLSVQIKSAAEDKVSNAFNVTSQLNSMFANPGNLYMEGYSINNKGFITLPVIGELKVIDLTLDEVQNLIQSGVNRYLNDATVMVKLTSFKIT